MRTTEISTSLWPPCLLPNPAPPAARSPQPPPSAQVNTEKSSAAPPLLPHVSSRVSPGSGGCLQHGYVLNSRYQVVYPFPTFQPAFQLKKDQVILLNTSYSLVACGVSLCPGTPPAETQLCSLSTMHQSAEWGGDYVVVFKEIITIQSLNC